jgi:hypothetical protein
MSNGTYKREEEVLGLSPHAKGEISKGTWERIIREVEHGVL